MRNRNFQFNTLNLLIGINIFVFALGVLFRLLFSNSLGSVSSTNINQSLYILGGLVTDPRYLDELFRFVTTNFLHYDPIHIMLNLLALLFLGRKIYEFYGGGKLFITYIIGGISASILTFLIYNSLGINAIAIGASGSNFALAGLLVGGILKNRRFGMDLPFNLYELVPLFFVGIIAAILPDMGINNWAHLGGFIAGIILGLFLKNEIGDYRSKFDRESEKYLSLFCTIIFVLSYILLIINFINLIFNT